MPHRAQPSSSTSIDVAAATRERRRLVWVLAGTTVALPVALIAVGRTINVLLANSGTYVLLPTSIAFAAVLGLVVVWDVFGPPLWALPERLLAVLLTILIPTAAWLLFVPRYDDASQWCGPPHTDSRDVCVNAAGETTSRDEPVEPVPVSWPLSYGVVFGVAAIATTIQLRRPPSHREVLGY